jgi:hypothetical protein
VSQSMQSPEGRPTTVSAYVPEPNLDWLTAPTDRFAQHPMTGIEPGSASFLCRLNEHFNRERPTRLRDEFEYHLCMLSRLLDYNLGAFGLYIGKYNVKLRRESDSALALVVTDVAVYIPRVVRSQTYDAAVQSLTQSRAHEG